MTALPRPRPGPTGAGKGRREVTGRAFTGRLRRQALLLGLAAAALALVAWWGPLDEVEGVAVDLMMRAQPGREPHPDVAVVAIDAASLDRHGRWPWRRDLTARLVDRLAEKGAAVIALDILFSDPSRNDEVVDLSAEDDALAASLGGAGSVVLGYFFRRTTGRRESPRRAIEAVPHLTVVRDSAESRVPARPRLEANLPLFGEAAASQGFFDQEPESGVHRHYGLVTRYDGRHYPALALAAVAELKGVPPWLEYRAGLPDVWLGDRPVSADEGGRLWIAYRGPGGTFPPISAAQVLAAGTPDLTGKLVFVGFTETGLGEIFTSPWGDAMTGVEVHAHVADNLLRGRYIHDSAVQRIWSILAALLLAPLVSFLAVATPGRPWGAVAAVAATLAWPVVAYLAFVRAGWHLHVTAPLLAGLLALLAQVAFEGRSRWIQRTFRQFVSADVVNDMLRHPERVRLGGESRELTVLFCDVRGFTALSENREPQQVVEILNRFFTPMTAMVIDHGGTVDKYMGDALMAFFGAPGRQEDHAVRACRAALAMVSELERVKGEAEAELLPENFGVGVGVNTGVMTVGNMGSEQIFDYTVIGDPVNLGSRVEGLTRVYGVDVVVSEFTRAAVLATGGADLCFRELDRVRVKGRREPVGVYELRAASDDPRDADRLRRHADALAAYRERRFAEAAATLDALLTDFPGDGPARELAGRCRDLAAQPPPEDWQPVLERTSK